jgi:hypothetical protein
MNCLFEKVICGWTEEGGNVKANVVGDGTPWVMGSAREDVGCSKAGFCLAFPNHAFITDRRVCRRNVHL